MSKQDMNTQAIDMILSVQAHGKAYEDQARDLLALAMMAAEHGDYAAEHALRAEADMKLMCAELVTKAAERMRKYALCVAEQIQNRLG